jgi:hypothetical protein
LRALTTTLHHVGASPQDRITLSFQPISDYALVNAIEVLDEAP